MKSTRLGQWTIESLIADSSGNASVWLVSNSSGEFGALKIRAKINRFATSHQFCRPLRRDLGSLLIPFPALKRWGYFQTSATRTKYVARADAHLYTASLCRKSMVLKCGDGSLKLSLVKSN